MNSAEISFPGVRPGRNRPKFCRKVALFDFGPPNEWKKTRNSGFMPKKNPDQAGDSRNFDEIYEKFKIFTFYQKSAKSRVLTFYGSGP